MKTSPLIHIPAPLQLKPSSSLVQHQLCGPLFTHTILPCFCFTASSIRHAQLRTRPEAETSQQANQRQRKPEPWLRFTVLKPQQWGPSPASARSPPPDCASCFVLPSCLARGPKASKLRRRGHCFHISSSSFSPRHLLCEKPYITQSLFTGTPNGSIAAALLASET